MIAAWPWSAHQSRSAPGVALPVEGTTGSSAEAASASITSGGTVGVVTTQASGLCRSTSRAGRSRSTSAMTACVSGSDPGCSPGDERLVRFGERRSRQPGG